LYLFFANVRIAYNTHERIEKGIQNELGTPQRRDHLVSVYIYEKIILKLYLKNMEFEDVDLIHVAQDKD
jgi:hypothetical protein